MQLVFESFYTVLTESTGYIWRTGLTYILERTKIFLCYFLHRRWIYVKRTINVNVIVYLKWYIDFIMVAVYYNVLFLSSFFFLSFVYDNLVNAILRNILPASLPLLPVLPPGTHFFRSLLSHFEIIIQKYDWWLQAIFFVVHSRGARHERWYWFVVEF